MVFLMKWLDLQVTPVMYIEYLVQYLACSRCTVNASEDFQKELPPTHQSSEAKKMLFKHTEMLRASNATFESMALGSRVVFYVAWSWF